MRISKLRACCQTFAAILACTIVLAGSRALGQQAGDKKLGPAEVERDRVEPHWLDEGHFWYQNELNGGGERRREDVFVDAEAAKRLAVDDNRLLEAVARAMHRGNGTRGLSLSFISFAGDSVVVSAEGSAWDVNLSTLGATPAVPRTTRPATSTAATRPMRHRRRDMADEAPDSMVAPNHAYTAVFHDGNIFLRKGDAAETQLSHDGTEAFAYNRVFWSPDSTTLVAYRMEPGDHKPVYRLESSPKGPNGATGGGVGRAVLHTDEYALPGDKLDSFELNLFSVPTGSQIKPAVERIDMSADGQDPWPEIRWRPDGKHFLYEKYDRGHQRLRIIEVDATDGHTRTVLDEQSKTFIWTAHTENLNLHPINYLRNDNEIIYASERSGWRQLYLLDIDTGVLKPMTSGNWVLRGIERIDEDARQIWFSACGVYPGQDPYLLQYGRVNFDGSGLTWLTEADGNHTIKFDSPNTFSPGGSYFVVSYSRVDLPPVTELRSAQSGKLILTLERATVSDDWFPPEVFVAKGRDGVTDIWGIICRPRNLDQHRNYPIIEEIYAGPQGSYVPKTFSPWQLHAKLSSMGFIVVQIDGMGTANRSKAFHDVCWKNLADAGFPDRIKWIKAAAAKYPYMDIDRVGIFGTSAGGQNAAGALLFHPEFYKVAVANCGCHDNRMDKVSWNEQWMGFPVGPQYSACSNIDHAANLRGRLQLVLGEMDSNVPVESTYRFVNALVQARKDFEFVLIPGADHGAESPITSRKLCDFFQRYLLATEPPNHNDG
ncbi:MAG TPA: prolyl oligopeptidase family serine peptidase [Phycisphaerae bacterium]|nr:prolyl oligopeptidase family serine peptidase [Phycisphaerae bacterium]